MQFISLVFLLFATILGIIVGAAVDDNPVTFNCGKDVNPVGFCSQYLLAVDKGRGAYKSKWSKITMNVKLFPHEVTCFFVDAPD
jgi:hypothetical protein